MRELLYVPLPEVMRCVLIYMLEVMRCVPVLDVLDVPELMLLSEVMRCVLICMLEVVEVPEVMRRVPSACWRLWRFPKFAGRAGGDATLFAGGVGGDALCANLYAGGGGGA